MAAPNGIATLMRFIIAVCLLTAQSAFADYGRLALVMVTNVSSSIDRLNRHQIRKIYLGSPSDSTTPPVQALINRSDSLLYEIFLQRVLFMSTKAYERHVRNLKPALGAVSPRDYRSESRLVEYLKSHPGSVAFMTAQTAAQLPGLKVIARL